MSERKTKGGYESGPATVSDLLAGGVPEALFRPGAGATVPEPQDAAPRVPNLACPKCGEPDAPMRWCDGMYSLHWGACFAKEPKDHFHRKCSRCGHAWTTYDTLDGGDA